MSRTVVIDPVTRIEGHARITLTLDDDGSLADARFHVTEFRGFEEFCRGRPVWEMPSITARICGICPVSHLLASAKAGDAVMGVTPPPTGHALRVLANLAQLTQSHALSFFHLSAPDLLLGWDHDPATRNVFGLMAAQPDLARAGIRLRSFGQGVIEAVAGRKVHSPGIVSGGVAEPMTLQTRDTIKAGLPEALATAQEVLALYLELAPRFGREAASFGAFPSLFLAMANEAGTWEHHDGYLKVVDSTGAVRSDHVAADDYLTVIGEAAVRDSYLKAPYYRPAVGERDPISLGMYRVGPLARLNVCDTMGSPLADAALEAYRSRTGRIARSSFHYHHARLVEVIACLERMERMLDDPLLLGRTVRAEAGVNELRAVGISEAPRGTLFHDYTVDENGILSDVNLIVATGQNNLAMGETVKQIAQEFIGRPGRGGDPPEIPEGVLNRIEAGIRAYDPCLSCSTHAAGRMPLIVVIEDARGHEVARAVHG
jgi:NAD-reducing hydrogenase large subunit